MSTPSNLPQRAGILCNDDQFRAFAATRCGLPGHQFGAEATAVYLRQVCQIRSRRELAENHAAQERFERLRTEFDAWRGRIAAQR
ncbi:hypothetical protein [Marinovum algicola]|uniref:hypothetical protein n=1 Tax=Marinovum algicola TaxID=42444 RepID=UPI0024B8822D|nr:hypothetical protein [Marinovum algicola]